jgi:putative ABC transport system permease protein
MSTKDTRNHPLDNLDEDIRLHIEIETQDNIAKGMSPKEAHYAAVRKFGNVTKIKEDTHEIWNPVWLEQFLQDIRYGMRILRKNPGFTAIAVLTLALGIGANTAIFSVVYAVLLKPLPYPQPTQLVTIFETEPQEGVPFTGMSYPNLTELRQQNSTFTEIAGTQQHQLTLIGRGEPTVVNASIATPELFSLFQVHPLAGRIFYPEDGKHGAAPVTILSENLWRTMFNADPKIVGGTIELDKRSFTVVGVMPAAFRFPNVNQPNQLWVPLVQDPVFGQWMDRRGGHYLRITARLKPGISPAQAQTELDTISARLAAEFPDENRGWQIHMMPLHSMLIENVKPALLVLFGAVGLVLLIACTNLANLLLTRATSRGREIAVRTALGAGRKRIVRQLLTETAVLGLLGGIAGIGLAYWGVQALSALLPPDFPQLNAIRVDNFVLAFALVLAVLASCAFGLAPALFAANSNLQSNLREGGARSGELATRRRARSYLAAAEIALAMVLLVAAGLFLRSFSKLISVNPGFDAEHTLQANIDLPISQYATSKEWAAFSSTLLANIQAQPGLQNSAVVVPRPITDGQVNIGFGIEGNPPLSPGTSRTADFVSISPEYFQVMAIPLLAGRPFDQRDSDTAPRVAVINQQLARTYFPNQNPIGKFLTFGLPPEGEVSRQIVGVVGDVRDVSLGQNPGPMMYAPYTQATFWGANLVIKTTLNPESVANAVREQVHRIDKDLPITGIAQIPEEIEASAAQPKFRTVLLSLFAGMALILSAIGIFGVISYSVSCRTNEIGIRVALGATRANILQMILKETLILAATGLSVGIPAALAASHLLSHMLFNVSATDPLTLAAVVAILAAVAATAGYLPARRATKVDPIRALRYE